MTVLDPPSAPREVVPTPSSILFAMLGKLRVVPDCQDAGDAAQSKGYKLCALATGVPSRSNQPVSAVDLIVAEIVPAGISKFCTAAASLPNVTLLSAIFAVVIAESTMPAEGTWPHLIPLAVVLSVNNAKLLVADAVNEAVVVPV